MTNTAEKIIEKSLAQNGKESAVTINPDTQSISMTIKGDKEETGTMDIQVGEESASMVIRGENGNMEMLTGANAGIPANFPKDIPLHSSLKVNMSINDGATGFTLQTSSNEKFETLVDYYQKESTKLGWEEQMNMLQNPDAPMQMMIYKKDKRIMNIIVQQAEESVGVTITASQE
ncbi:MAG: hypothetical protein KAH38_06720 [Candidatus Hydrogenedentes bacterium]|nr:hypothetical protein [Candidatus Hydrogenedentota bacterium]